MKEWLVGLFSVISMVLMCSATYKVLVSNDYSPINLMILTFFCFMIVQTLKNMK